MNVILILIVMLVISLIANVVIINFYGNIKKEKLKMEDEAIRAKADLDYYVEINNLKKEVSKEYAESEKKLNSGDNHSRNSCAADILRNNKRN